MRVDADGLRNLPQPPVEIERNAGAARAILPAVDAASDGVPAQLVRPLDQYDVEPSPRCRQRRPESAAAPTNHGKITAQTILQAFQDSREELNERFGKLVPSLGQSFQVLKNRVLDYVGQTDKALGVSAALGKVLIGLSDNLDTVTRAVVGLAAA